VDKFWGGRGPGKRGPGITKNDQLGLMGWAGVFPESLGQKCKERKRLRRIKVFINMPSWKLPAGP